LKYRENENILYSKRVDEEYCLTVDIKKYNRRKANFNWSNDIFQARFFVI